MTPLRWWLHRAAGRSLRSPLCIDSMLMLRLPGEKHVDSLHFHFSLSFILPFTLSYRHASFFLTSFHILSTINNYTYSHITYLYTI